jgi:hypothetical protein
MSPRLVVVIAAGLALSGCGTGSVHYVPPSSSELANWDGLGRLPQTTRKKIEAVAPGDASPKETELAALKPYSKEWWSVRDAIDRADEVKLAKKLIICRGCIPR